MMTMLALPTSPSILLTATLEDIVIAIIAIAIDANIELIKEMTGIPNRQYFMSIVN